MARQSTRSLVLIEPVNFGYNPETAATNKYQIDARESADAIGAAALAEFRAYRDMLVEAGVNVLTMKSAKGCPDGVFPNWFSTHENGTAWTYPMLCESRRRERSDELAAFFRNYYTVRDELVPYEKEGRALESTSSLVLDRVNKVAYVARSRRTDEELARRWCAKMDYEPVVFDTVDHTGGPVYHTDLVIWIGTQICGVCEGAILESDRPRVMQSLARGHEVLGFDNAQLRNYCGNSIEVMGEGDTPFLVMSQSAFGLLTSEQLSRLHRYYARVLTPSLPTIQIYGGGSARCLVQELF